MLDFCAEGRGFDPQPGKTYLIGFFSFPVTFGGQCGNGSLEACRGEASAGLSLEPVRHL